MSVLRLLKEKLLGKPVTKRQRLNGEFDKVCTDLSELNKTLTESEEDHEKTMATDRSPVRQN